MGGRITQAGGVLSAFTGVALVVFGAYSVRSGAATIEQAIAYGLFAVAVVAGYHSLTDDTGSRPDAIGNTALFVGGAAVYSGGVNFAIDPAVTAGQALFAIAVVYFVIRLD